MDKKRKRNIKKKIVPNPKEVFDVFKNDLKEIRHNFVLLIIVLGITIVPSLYAWFNIEAFWDPYSNTKYLKVAVINEDEGVDFQNQKVVFGDKIIDELKANNSLDWQFVSSRKATKGLEKGEYYAEIEIPKDFSKDMISVTKKEVKKAHINYYINEKINPIAPKVTDKGASTIQQQISQTLVESISKVSLMTLGTVANGIGNIEPKLNNMEKTLKTLDKQIESAQKLNGVGKNTVDRIDKSVRDLKSTSDSLKNTTDSIRNLSGNISSSANQMSNNTKTALNSITPRMKDNLYATQEIMNQIGDNIDIISKKQDKISSSSIDLIESSRRSIGKVNSNIENLADTIDRLNFLGLSGPKRASSRLRDYSTSLNTLDSQLSNAESIINSGNDLADSTIKSITESYNNSINRANTIVNNFDGDVAQPINQILDSANGIGDDVDSILEKTSSIFPQVNSFANSMSSANGELKTGLSYTDESLSLLRTQVGDAIDLIHRIKNDKTLKDFKDIVNSNIMKRVEFIKEPVSIEENKLYPVANYGAAMTPFYSVLACWVGVLILLAIMSTNVNRTHKRPIDEYFGRMLLFLMLACIQSIIISAGNFLLLGVEADHPWLFTLLMMFFSVCFTSIIYSLVSLFGTVGKGIAVVLLVIQIGGSGGTFPVQMEPLFFRLIHNLIPFTYAIGALREAVGGIYMPNLLHDISILLLFFIVPIVISVLLKDFVKRKTRKLNEKFHSTSLTGH